MYAQLLVNFPKSEIQTKILVSSSSVSGSLESGSSVKQLAVTRTGILHYCNGLDLLQDYHQYIPRVFKLLVPVYTYCISC